MTNTDVIVMGGGPAATVCAIELARRDRRVILLDADFAPRYRVGESLSPTACEVLESVGVHLAGAGFVAKHGATFAWGGRGTFRVRYAGAGAWQVRRAELDSTLLKLAEDAGVQVRRGHRATRVRFVGKWATGVRLRADDGSVRDVEAPWIVDATGRSAVLAHQLQLLDGAATRADHYLMWSYWRNGNRLPAEAAGDGLFVGGGGRAWWYLPVDDRDGMVAVGVLTPGSRPDVPVRDVYLDAVAGTTRIEGLLAAAQHVGPVRTAPARSYVSRRMVGHGWLLVGDAAGFIDPILTPGVQLAVQFGQLAAVAIDAALRGDPRASRALGEYEHRLRRQLRTYRWLTDNLYAAARADGGDLTLAWGDERSDRMTFLSVIAGTPPHQLAPLLGEYLAMRAAAVRYGGAPPVFGETEGFAFLMWLARRQDAGSAHPTGTGPTVRLAPGTQAEDVHALADLSAPSAAASIRAVCTRDGDRFLLTWELETLLRVLARDSSRAELVHRFAAASGSTPDPAAFDRWLDLLTQHGLLECLPEPARADPAGATRAGN
jgi:flavin-dependent dehydrogenase